MKCLSPVSIPAKVLGADANRKMLVPCGKCINCLRSRQASWIYRLQRETSTSKYAYFVTLTYDESHVPLIYRDTLEITDYNTYIQNWNIRDVEFTINPRDFTLYIKRLRKKLGDIKCKFYACMEYGDQFNRPHAHFVIFFNECSEYVQYAISSAWNKGFVTIEPITDSRIAYVTKYISKSDLEAPPSDISLPCTQRASHGLGVDGFFIDESYHNPLVGDLEQVQLNNGTKIRVPRYFRRKFFENETYTIDNLIENERERNKQDKISFERYCQDIKLCSGSVDIEKARSSYLQNQDPERLRRNFNLTHKRRKGL